MLLLVARLIRLLALAVEVLSLNEFSGVRLRAALSLGSLPTPSPPSAATRLEGAYIAIGV